MDFLREANSKKIFRRRRSVPYKVAVHHKIHLKWTFYGKLILKRYLDAEDWFRDRAAVQRKIPFRIDFYGKLIHAKKQKFII